MVKYTRKNYRGGGSRRSERRKCRKYKEAFACNDDRDCAWCNTGCNGRKCPRCMKIDNVMYGKHCSNEGDQDEARKKYTYRPYVKPKSKTGSKSKSDSKSKSGSKSKLNSKKKSLSKLFQKKPISQLRQAAIDRYGKPGIQASNIGYILDKPPDKSTVAQWKKETLARKKEASKKIKYQTVYDSQGFPLQAPHTMDAAKRLLIDMDRKLPTIRSSALGKLRKNTKRKKNPKKKKQSRRRNQTKRLR